MSFITTHRFSCVWVNFLVFICTVTDAMPRQFCGIWVWLIFKIIIGIVVETFTVLLARFTGSFLPATTRCERRDRH